MCGISGIITSACIIKKNLESTLALMRRRGPDYKDCCIGKFESKNFALLHSRLAIIDLNPSSNQPFIDNEFQIIFNGEIFNYVELRETLKHNGYKFNTSSDTEVILKAYQAFGSNCVKYFNGMWAFVIYDKKKKIFFFSRDRFGEKPLYYYKDSKCFVFGSEVKFIKSLLSNELEVNKSKIFNSLNFGYKSLHKDNQCFYENIFSLGSGENLTVDENMKLKKKRYWFPQNKINYDISYQDIVIETDKILTNSLKMRMRSDVPLAFCLSGGVDSGYLASLAKKKLSKEISTFSIIDSDHRYNEIKNIDKITNDLRCHNEKIFVNKKKNFFERLKLLISQHDSPISTLSYYIHSFLTEKISKEGYKVIISGTGADEIFTGYYDHFPLYFASMDKENLDYKYELYLWKKNILPFIRNKKLKEYDLYIKNPEDRSISFGLTNKLRNILKNKKKVKTNFQDNYLDQDPLKNRLLNELFHEVVPVILRHDDLNSMYYSLENRSPFLDHNLFEFIAQIPSKFLIKDSYSKSILRDISKNILADDVRTARQKIGFNANLNSLVSKKEIRDYLFNNIEILEDYIEPNHLFNFIDNEKDLFNGENNKFLFSLINCKMFLELNN